MPTASVVEAAALALEGVMRALEGKTPKKVIVVPEPHREHRRMKTARCHRCAVCSLAGCGFHPLYGRCSWRRSWPPIYVEPIAERDGYELRNSLIDLLQSDGDEAGKRYRLEGRR